MEHIYEQALGLWTEPSGVRHVGYAGRGLGRNNPDYEDRKNVGPLPAGIYNISLPYSSETHGPTVMRLQPVSTNRMFGRSGFLVHGDNTRGDASRGCIVLSRSARLQIAASGCRRLRVVSMVRPNWGGEPANSTTDAQVTPSSDRVA